jgi:hypothetical protein
MSTFAWIDHSEKQRRQMLEAIDLFREKDTRDELGIATVRDALADLLFPGTGTLQTRARYFFFVPWMYGRFEENGVRGTDLTRAAREFELHLIDTLAASVDSTGTIGVVARRSLQRLPSSIYWNGLQVFGIRRFDGSQAEYHRSFERLRAARKNRLRNDDGEIVSTDGNVWAAVPHPPATFPQSATLSLAESEASFLRERIIEHDPTTLFAFLVQREAVAFDVPFAWDLPDLDAAPASLVRHVEHARNFSETLAGAAIIYNLNLAEMEPVRVDARAHCLDLLDKWQSLMEARRDAHRRWDRQDFWNSIREAGTVPNAPTQWFVDAWNDLAIGSDPAGLATNRQARELVVHRERAIKGPLARCDNTRAREVWHGDSGLRRLDYRWRTAATFLKDIATALGGGHARGA